MKSFFLLILSFLTISTSAFSASSIFYSLVSDYELKMDNAATAYMNKNYGRSLDNFKIAKELLAKSVFSSSEGFEWEACQSLQSYTLVLARMAESEMYQSNKQADLYKQVVKQANTWADRLLLQGKSWYKINSLDEKEIRFRQKWLSRYRSVIMKARKLNKELE